MTTDLFIFNTSSDEEVKQAVTEFKRRCSLLLDKAFNRKIDIVKNFESWFDDYVKATQDQVLVVHEEPLHVVCWFLDLDPANLSRETLNIAERVAVQENWY